MYLACFSAHPTECDLTVSFRLHRTFFEEELTPRGLLIHFQASLLVLALVLETTAKDDLSSQSGDIMVHDLLDVYTCLSVALASQESTATAVADLDIDSCEPMSLSSSLVTLKLTGVCDQLEPASKAYTGSHQEDPAFVKVVLTEANHLALILLILSFEVYAQCLT